MTSYSRDRTKTTHNQAGADLPSDWFGKSARRVAKKLLGCLMIRDRRDRKIVGRIIETEAYLSEDDPASHSFRGRTKRNSAMFGDPGKLYVYLIYGVHHCVNIVTGRAGQGEAVLIRSIEAGSVDATGRFVSRKRRPHVIGPARLAKCFGLTRTHDGLPLGRGNVSVLKGPRRVNEQLVIGPRVGITKGAEMPLRFRLVERPKSKVRPH